MRLVAGGSSGLAIGYCWLGKVLVAIGLAMRGGTSGSGSRHGLR